MHRFTVLALCAVCTLPAFAASTWEVTATGGTSDDDTLSYGLDAAWHMDGLAGTSPEPLAEAAFIERPRTVHAAFGRTETDSADFMGEPVPPLTRTQYSLEYVHRRASSRHVFSAGYAHDVTSVPVIHALVPPEGPPIITSDRVRSSGDRAAIGYAHYLLPRLTIGGLVAGTESDSGRDGSQFENTAIQFDLNLRWLTPLQGDRWFAVDAAISRVNYRTRFESEDLVVRRDSGNSMSYRAGALFYLNRHTSLGVNATYMDESETTSIGMNLRHFFSERFACGVSATRNFFDGPIDSTSYTASLTARF